MAEHYDIIIIGTGAGGGTLANHLAPSGKKILILERGGFLPREKENWDPEAVFVENRYTTPETWYDKDNKPFHPGVHYYVGGSTKVYGSALLRMRQTDFGDVKHYDGTSPAWPLEYQDLAPYYLEAETLYHVHGERGADPTEPPCEQPYPYPHVAHEPRIQELFEDLKKIGHHPFPLPLGLILDEQHKEKSPCIKCSTCDGFPCLVDGKADAHVVGVNRALQHDNVTLMTQTYVEKLITDPSGKEIKEVQALSQGTPVRFKGDIVIVSCGAVNSAALFLRSANDKHPNGLSNSSDCVGRFYMCHNNSALVALSRRPNPTKFQKTIGLNDFYYGAEDSELPLGHIQMLGKSQGPMFRGDAPRITPEIALDEMASHAIDFWLTTEDLPDPNNRVTINDKGVISLHYTENNLEPHKRLTDKLKNMLSHIGCENTLLPRHIYLGKKIPIQGTAHQVGTLRFGKDPKSSVLDIHCKSHEIDNLYAVDGSFFCSSSAVNPGLTIMANALRVGDHLLERLKS
ncbi:MAG: GMC family oxidoreductase [Chlamydiales bacterium]